MKNKKLLAAAAAAFLAGSALPGAAAGWIEEITVRNGITLNINGETVVPVDASGKQMPVFLYQNTTYVPVGCISEKYGKEVEWDGENATVNIKDKETVNLTPDETMDGSLPSQQEKIRLADVLSDAAGWHKQADGTIVIDQDSSRIDWTMRYQYKHLHFQIARTYSTFNAGLFGGLRTASIRIMNPQSAIWLNTAFPFKRSTLISKEPGTSSLKI